MIQWKKVVVPRAADIVRSYTTGVTLRQLFYRLVAEGAIPNTRQAYQGLSNATVDPRRLGEFPPLVDRRRGIAQPTFWDDAQDVRDWLRGENGYREPAFRIDRTEGQPVNLYVGSEKDALSALLGNWLEERGIPVIVVGGWHSEGYERQINRHIDWRGDGRKGVLLYLGDLDPAGEGIESNIRSHVHFDDIIRVALDNDQAQELDLPENTDPEVERKLENHPGRIAFEAKYGRLFQIEVDAVPPDVLQEMVNDAIEPFWDQSAFEAALEREQQERDEL